jgi:hypothetical protein
LRTVHVVECAGGTAAAKVSKSKTMTEEKERPWTGVDMAISFLAAAVGGITPKC